MSEDKKSEKAVVSRGDDIEVVVTSGYGPYYDVMYDGKRYIHTNLFIKDIIDSMKRDKKQEIKKDEYMSKICIFEAIREGNLEKVKELIESGADVNAKDNSGETALMWAAWYDRAEIAKILIDNGADVNAKNRWGKTALTGAICWGNTEVAKLLEEAGAKE